MKTNTAQTVIEKTNQAYDIAEAAYKAARAASKAAHEALEAAYEAEREEALKPNSVVARRIAATKDAYAAYAAAKDAYLALNAISHPNK
jgi:hypothetical protein